jgi:hypothetical protein
MSGKNPANEVLVNVDAEGFRDDHRDTWAAEARISVFELDNGPDELRRWTLGPRLCSCSRREQRAVLLTH